MLVMAVLSWIPFFRRPYKEEETSAEESRPPASLVEVPVHLVASSIQEKLPVMEFGRFVEKLGRGKQEEGSTCAVCLRRIGEEDQVRELSNCAHAFHRECLDGWVGRGGATCPLCRSKLLPYQETSGESSAAATVAEGEDDLPVRRGLRFRRFRCFLARRA
ncbi:unnamed protein product [Thlaspi arvense]|uniref:RING-type domain-containing protein n=1 Tax=Thlaspi arvense TaxID=13288 RepID=A0AAU9RUY8_THLAR|nr:unnamed protein product [Thlaspi arvense]